MVWAGRSDFYRMTWLRQTETGIDSWVSGVEVLIHSFSWPAGIESKYPRPRSRSAECKVKKVR